MMKPKLGVTSPKFCASQTEQIVPSRMRGPEHILNSVSFSQSISSVSLAHCDGLSSSDTDVINEELNSEVHSPINYKALDFMLQGYPEYLRKHLVHSFKFGFHIDFRGPEVTYEASNSAMANSLPQAVTDKIEKELMADRLAGPFVTPPYHQYRVSPLSIREKKQKGTYRLIHDLSYPYDANAVNAGIPKESASVRYQNLNMAIKNIIDIKDKHQKVYMAKIDIKSAFRLIPIDPQQYHLFGMKWQGVYYFDKFLAMGNSQSCAIFESFSDALQWIFVNKYCPGAMCIKYLDDFLFQTPDRESCMRSLENFKAMCYSLQVPIAEEKTEGPSEILEFLGVQLDSTKMHAVLPDNKIHKLSQLIDETLQAKKVTLKDMQVLLGNMCFAASVIRPGRAFSRRLIATTIGIKHQFHHIRLPLWAKLDLYMWKKLIQDHNGCVFFNYFHRPSTVEHALVTDASGIGCGGHWGLHWFNIKWPPWYTKSFKPSIALLELYPIFAACHMLGHRWRDQIITIKSDNMAVVSILTKQSSPDLRIMALMREIVFLSMKYNFLYNAQFVPGMENTFADKLSRFKEFRSSFPYANKDPLAIPDFLQVNRSNNILTS